MSQNTEQKESEPPTNAQRLHSFKNSYITAASAIDKLKEPLQELIEIKDFLYAVEKEQLMAEADWAKFVNEDVGPGMAKRCAKERSYNENVSLVSSIQLRCLLLGYLTRMNFEDEV